MRSTCWMMLGAFAFTLPNIGLAQDDDQPQPRRLRRATRLVAASPYWIGVHAVPVDAALRSHLELGDRIIVGHVMPNSPAAEAGVQLHDILLKLGDANIAGLNDLIQSVADNEGEATTLTVIRAGKEKTLEITPTKRPEDITFETRPDAIDGLLRQYLVLGEDGRGLRMFGPGIIGRDRIGGGAAGGGSVYSLVDGKAISVQIQKQNDEPAKITVKRDNDSWEVTEDSLDELPDDLREHVEMMLNQRGGGRARVLRNSPQLRLVPGDLRNRSLRGDDPLNELRKELRSLRKQVERLGGGDDADDESDSDDGSSSDLPEA